MAYRSFEELEVWQRARLLAVNIYRQLRSCRDYGLRDQLIRAAISIASNIAEGAERGSKAEFKRFLNIAKGSAAELRTQLYIAADAGVIAQASASALNQETVIISKQLHALIKTLS